MSVEDIGEPDKADDVRKMRVQYVLDRGEVYGLVCDDGLVWLTGQDIGGAMPKRGDVLTLYKSRGLLVGVNFRDATYIFGNPEFLNSATRAALEAKIAQSKAKE